MREFLRKIMAPGGVIPPQPCLDAFKRQFADAVRTDWSSRAHLYEVIFYKDQLEHIACYNAEGNLLEYKMHLPAEHLPSSVMSRLNSRGEVMNAVLANDGISVQYEVIIRDPDQKRHLFIISGTGEFMEERSL